MLKKFLVGTVVALALGVFLTASASYDFGSATLRVGSKGDYVKTLQTLVGATADGSFGPMTAAKVKVWQAANGLVADGVFGPLSMAKANLGLGGTSTTYPAGCTSAMGYSSTTGVKCDSTTPSTPTGLTGAEGDITVSDFTSGTETTLGEGKSEKVLGVKVEADNGSDVSLSTMKVVINGWANGADNLGSSRLERHIDGVDIYMGTTKVGSADVEDFSKDSTTYTKSVALSGAVIKKGEDAKFYVAVNAASSIDSENEDNTWNVDVTSIRFQDAMGVVTTIAEDGSNFDVAAAGIDFESATANDEITSLTSSANPDSTTLLVKDNGNSEEYMVFAFKFKADKDSSDLNVLEIPITANPLGAGLTADDVVSDIYLKVGSTVYDNSDLTGDIYTFTIDEGDLTIDGGETIEVKVYASFNEEGLVSTYDTGEKITFSLDASEILVENVDGDSITNSATDKSGEQMTLSTSEATVGEYSWTVSATGTMLDFFFTVDNTDGTEAFDVTTADVNDELASGSTGTIRTDSNVYETDIQGVVTWYSGDSVTPTASTKYTVAAGDKATFRVRYSLGATATTAVTATQNGQWAEVKVNSVAGETVPDNKVHSPTATVNL